MQPEKGTLITLLLIVIIPGIPESSFSQKSGRNSDTVRIEESVLPLHSPTRASLFSTVLPGLGQVYNKKYWKVPLIYGGMTVCVYFAIQQNDVFREKRDAYVSRLAHDSTDKFLMKGNFYTNPSLLKSMNINKRNRDLMIILASGVYLLQIFDAAVDAHLFYFNVSDDLSIRYLPNFNYTLGDRRGYAGLYLGLFF